MENITKAQFAEAYKTAILEEMRQHPEKFAYGEDKVDKVVSRAIDEFTYGYGTISPNVKRACKALGIPAKSQVIKAILVG